jgi:hypothetical protein
MRHSRLAVLVVAVLLGGTALLPRPVAGQGGWRWPEEPENLKVLPPDTGGRELRAVMTGFTRALGVRCSHCHAGEEGEPLSTYDFVSDEPAAKGVAREMMLMLGEINERIGAMETGESAVAVTCVTCHAGRAVPRPLEDELAMALDADGPDAVLSRYEELRERYHGRGAYDFGERALNDAGYRLLERGETARAVDVFERNVELFPDSFRTHDSLGEAYAAAGEPALAIRHYERSLALEPRNRNAAEKLEELRSP